MGFLAGKRALIVGLATERSIAYGIAQAMRREGAELAFSYQERFKDRVEAMAAEFGAGEVFEMDVASDDSINAGFATLKKKWDALDIVVHAVAFAPSDAIRGGFVESTTRENFRIAHDISSYSLTALAKPPSRVARSAARYDLTYLARSARSHYSDGRRQGASGPRSLLAADLGPTVSASCDSAWPIKTLASRGSRSADAGPRASLASTATSRSKTSARAAVLAPTWRRHHGRGDLCGGGFTCRQFLQRGE